MQKLTQAEVKERADKWAEVQKKIGIAEASKKADKSRYEIEIEKVDRDYEPTLTKLHERAVAIEREVIDWLQAYGKPITLCGEFADAVNESKIGNRVIDPRKCFEAAKEKFWECVVVGVAKAEKVLGREKVDQISLKEKKLVASLTLK